MAEFIQTVSFRVFLDEIAVVEEDAGMTRAVVDWEPWLRMLPWQPPPAAISPPIISISLLSKSGI